jgi:hypothetical protein
VAVSGQPQGVRNDFAPLAFVLGFARSGTTLLGRILACVPEVVVLEEKPLLGRAIAHFMTDPVGLERLAAAEDAQLDSYRADFWQRAGSFGVTAANALAVDQTALNSVNLPLIGRLFPQARIVFVIRDPRDVVLSCFRRQFAPTPLTLEFHSLASTALIYDRTMRLVAACRRRMSLQLHELRYEDLLDDFDGETRRLCRFLDIPWTEAMREFHRSGEGRMLATRSAAQVRQGLSRDSIGHWRAYRDQMAEVMPLLAPWIAAFGYDEE